MVDIPQFPFDLDEDVGQPGQDATQLQQQLDPAAHVYTSALPWYESWQDFMGNDLSITIDNHNNNCHTTTTTTTSNNSSNNNHNHNGHDRLPHHADSAFHSVSITPSGRFADNFDSLWPQGPSHSTNYHNHQIGMAVDKTGDRNQQDKPQDGIVWKTPPIIVGRRRPSQQVDGQTPPRRPSYTLTSDGSRANAGSLDSHFTKNSAEVTKDHPSSCEDEDDLSCSDNDDVSFKHAPTKERDLKSRNRMSAKKHRNKKKQTMEGLIQQQMRERELNEELRDRVEALRDEFTRLRMQLLDHSNCNCKLIQSYIKSQAQQDSQRRSRAQILLGT